MTPTQPEGAAAAPVLPDPAPTPPSTATGTPAPGPAADTTAFKPIHSLVLDTGPLIKNEIAISTLLAQAEVLYTIPAVISEIRDEATRSRLQTSLLPFLTLRSPRPESVKFVSDFARKTGDLQVLSRPDLHLIALTYELECERNHGDWRLRKEPGQKTVNGKPPAKEGGEDAVEAAVEEVGEDAGPATTGEPDTAEGDGADPPDNPEEANAEIEEVESQVRDLALEDLLVGDASASPAEDDSNPGQAEADAGAEEAEDDSDSDGWITPSNIKKHQERDGLAPKTPSSSSPPQKTLQACLLTTDLAMQNVSLRMNLNCAAAGGGPGSSSVRRITHLRTWVLRCHGCFTVTRQPGKQFCGSCGQPTLTRVSCSTGTDGTVKLHLRRGFQYNTRGNVYSIPKPVHGSSSGKTAVTGGGKGGWGKELILAEDQKEYTKKMDEDRRTKVRDLMDDDYLPNLLSGHRSGGSGRTRVGAGRNVNSRRR